MTQQPSSTDRPAAGRSLQSRAVPPPRVGTLAWEQANGPPLSLRQKVETLTGAAAVVLADLGPRLRWQLTRWGMLAPRWPAKVDLATWAPPDTRAAREAEQYLREVATLPMIHHSLRTYYFSGIMADLSGMAGSVDREALYVAAMLHDVGLHLTPAPTDHCFTIGGARQARRIARDAGWDEARQDKIAVAITTNLNASVPLEEFGPEAHFMRVGGLVEVIAQEWNVHPDNLAEILARFPRTGFATDAVAHVGREIQHHPGSRFACLDPLFSLLLRRSRFSQER